MLLIVSIPYWRTHAGSLPGELGWAYQSHRGGSTMRSGSSSGPSCWPQNPPTLEAVHMSCYQPALAAHELDTFVRRVLRLAIEQVCARQAQELSLASRPAYRRSEQLGNDSMLAGIVRTA